MERRNTEWLKLAIQIAVLIVGIAGAYYKLDARVTIAEDRVAQETRGYELLLKSFNDRMDKTDAKLDKLNERIWKP
jgi:hypothetical protein